MVAVHWGWCAGGGIAEHAHLIGLGEVMARARAGDHLVQKLVAKG